MIEAIIIEYLTEALPDITVSGMVRPDAGTTFITVEKTGSNEIDQITEATLAIQSWAATQAEAASLNERVKDAMKALVFLPEISRSHCDTDYNNPRLSDKHPRYQAVFSVVFKEINL